MIHRSPFFLAAALSLVVSVVAQVPTSWRGAAGVTVVDGQPYAVGPAYRASFDARGATFTPALGRRAATPHELRFELESVRRGSRTWFEREDAACPPTHDERRVTYPHRGDFREAWEARSDGLEQTLVFDWRPEGSGDLVVRSRIASDLPLESSCEKGGLRFFEEGVGGITIGGVTGVDANGARAAGTVRHGAGFVEFTLPAAFVDDARYPLVLDPLVGTAFAIGDQPGGIDKLPAVSFDESTQRWLVVWVVQFGQYSAELRGQLLSATGSPVFGAQVLSNSASDIESPKVVNVNTMNRFLVVYRTLYPQTTDLRCLAVSASTGSSTASVQLNTNSSYDFQVAAGGDPRASGDRVLVAFTEVVAAIHEKVQTMLVQVPAGGSPVVTAADTLATNTNQPWVFGDVAVSRSCGTAGRWLVCWRQQTEIRCAAMSEVGTPCSPVTTVTTAGLFNGIGQIACATRDGNTFAVAWREPSLLGPPRLRLRPLSLLGVCPATVALGTGVTAVPDMGTAETLALDFAKDAYVVAWSQVVGGNQHVYVRTLDPATCGDCGTSHTVEPSVASQDEPAIASRWSSGDTTSDEALVVWTDGTIRGRRCEAHGAGAVTMLGGACGSGRGNVPGHTGAPVLGDATFALTLSSPTAPVIGAIVGLSNVSVPCGACTLVPNLDIFFGGAGPHPIPIPCDVAWLGVQFWVQWLVLSPGGCPLVPDFSFSAAQQFTIGE